MCLTLHEQAIESMLRALCLQLTLVNENIERLGVFVKISNTI